MGGVGVLWSWLLRHGHGHGVMGLVGWDDARKDTLGRRQSMIKSYVSI